MVGFDILRNVVLVRWSSIPSRWLCHIFAISWSSQVITPLKIINNKINVCLNCGTLPLISQSSIICLYNIDFQQNMLRNYKSQYRYEENQTYFKQQEISHLKKELFQTKDLQSDFMRLNDEVTALEAKYALMIDEKERLENQHKIKIQISKKNLMELRNDVDSLKTQIHKINVQIDDTLRENTTLRRMCDNRQAEIAALTASNREVQKNNELQIQENKNLALTLKTLKKQKNQAEEEAERLNKLLDDSICTLKQLEKEAKQLETSNLKLNSILALAEKDHANLLDELKQKETEVDISNKTLKQVTEETDDLRQSSSKLQKQYLKSQQQYKQLCHKLQTSCTKNKQFSLKLQSLENTLRTTEAQLQSALLKRDVLKKQHCDLADENKLLNSEIDQVLLSILEYERINKGLQKEVENYIACDQDVRSMLNRKEAMRGLLEEVAVKLAKTQEQIAHLR